MGQRSVVILDDGSILVGAIGRVLRQWGWEPVSLAVNPVQIAPALEQLQALAPDLIVMRQGLYAEVYPAHAQALLAEFCTGHLLVVQDEEAPASAAPLPGRPGDGKAPILCTAGELNAFLLARFGDRRGAAAAVAP